MSFKNYFNKKSIEKNEPIIKVDEEISKTEVNISDFTSEYFDGNWYLKVYEDVASNWTGQPIVHYLSHGWLEGRNPGPSFDTAKYMDLYCIGEYEGWNPLKHYEQVGKANGIIPPKTDYDLVKKSKYFDEEWYTKEYLSETGEWCGDAVLHYITIGWKQGNNPSIYFDAVRYSNIYRRDEREEINPLVHYELEEKNMGIIPPVTDAIVRNETLPFDKLDIKLAVKVNGGFGTVLVRMNYLYCLKEYIKNERLKIYAYGHRSMEMNDAIFKGQRSIYCYFPEGEWSKIDKSSFDAVIILDTYPKVLALKNDLEKKDKRLFNLIKKWNNFKDNKENDLYYNKPKVSKPFVYTSLINQGKTILNSADVTGELEIGREYRFEVAINKTKEQVLDRFGIDSPFITIQRGMNPKVKSEEGPKLWPVESFEKLIALLHEKFPQYKIVQLGESEERCKQLAGIDISLIGQTDWDDVKVLLSEAAFHIDGECGMVHLRKALHAGPSVVLFGPTPVDFFGYDGNINITANACSHWCVELTNDWEYHCPNVNENACMLSITPEMVITEMEKYLELGDDYFEVNNGGKELPADILEHVDEEYYENYLKTDVIYDFEITQVRIGDLQCHVYDGAKWIYIPLNQTPTYLYLTGDKSIYADYMKMRDKELSDENIHSVARFDSLIENVKENGFDSSKYIIIDALNNVRDGQHRAAIYMSLNGEDALVDVLRIYRNN